MNERIAETLKVLPDAPGVYIMHDAAGRVIYVGKAVILKNRVRSYFRKASQVSPKVRAINAHVDSIETIVCASEMEALILECNLIKKYRPRYNIELKDDKTYPYLKITVDEAYPRMYITRRVQKDGAKYYGPYADVGALRETMRLIRSMFPLRHCRSMNVNGPASSTIFIAVWLLVRERSPLVSIGSSLMRCFFLWMGRSRNCGAS